ncbi:hypothetical protein D3C80_921850 [compost metagenome]
MRPIQSPVAFSITENMPSPCRAHMPATEAMVRHTWCLDCTPPMKRVVSGSA